MTAPYDYDGLWNKATLFSNRSFSAVDDGSFEEAALWASVALELSGKAALAKINPLLIADPQDEGKSLLIAAGVSADHVGFKSVPAKAVFSRCARAFPPFNSGEAGRIAQNRNDDLHSASLPFSAIPADIWWQRYWAQAVLLVSAQDKNLVDFVGTDRLAGVEEHLAKNNANLALRLQALIERARQRLALIENAAISAKLAAELSAAATAQQDATYKSLHECPACHNLAGLYGDYAQDSEIQYDYDEGTAWETLTVYTERLACAECGLILDGPEFIAAASVSETFDVEQEVEPDYDEYGND